MNVLSLFDGISCGRVALERAGIKVDRYYASEIDEGATKISQKNYPDIIRLGDVTKWREWNIDWESIDLLIGGSPCQSLSITQSKTRKGLDGKSKLFFEFVDVLDHLKIYNPNILFLFENVASMSEESKIAIENCLGEKLIYQNSNAFSAQDRPRVYATNFEWDVVNEPCDLVLKDIMQDDVAEKYYYNCDFDFVGLDKCVCAYLHINGHDILKRVHSPFHKCHTLTAVCGGNQQKKVYVNGRCRKLTPLEYERLQNIPDGYTAGVADGIRYRTLGNGWSVDVIAHILSFIQYKMI
jgi:DNA (cytosine-5)-methyltransferase 3A